MGKRSALRGTATLFTVSDDGRQYQKFGLSEITNGMNTTLTPALTPRSQGSVQIRINRNKLLGLFLVYVKYYDETNRSYKQRFLSRPGDNSLPDHTVVPIYELPPNHQNCPRG